MRHTNFDINSNKWIAKSQFPKLSAIRSVYFEKNWNSFRAPLIAPSDAIWASLLQIIVYTNDGSFQRCCCVAFNESLLVFLFLLFLIILFGGMKTFIDAIQANQCQATNISGERNRQLSWWLEIQRFFNKHFVLKIAQYYCWKMRKLSDKNRLGVRLL